MSVLWRNQHKYLAIPPGETPECGKMTYATIRAETAAVPRGSCAFLQTFSHADMD